MAFVWFLIGFLTAIGVLFGAFWIFSLGMSVGKDKDSKEKKPLNYKPIYHKFEKVEDKKEEEKDGE